ncbi:MAG: hypothetical protein QOC93_1873 [Actinomycetota bacterium]|jgi:MFS family permease|nr:major facilitator superfamily 1 [Cryptosporangiaceae bacterium]MDQ1676729.1 hypothetical protein [Actinomycetota bacterium]
MPFVSALDRAQWRDVRVVALALSLAYLADFMVTTTLLLRLHDGGASGLVISGLLLASVLPLVVVAPVAGLLADRIDSRVLLGVAGAIQVVACLALAWVQNTAAVLALVAMLTAGLAVASPTLNALVPAMVDRNLLSRANGIIGAATTLGLILGPAAGGLLVGLSDTRMPVLLGAGLFVVFALVGLAVRTRRGTHADVAVSGGLLEGLRLLRADPALSRLLVLNAVLILLLQITNVFEVFLVRDTLHASAAMFGLIGAVWTVGMFAGSWLAGVAIRGDGGLLRWSLVAIGLQAVALTAVSTVPNAWWMAPLFAVGGVGNGAMNVLRQTLFGRRAPEHARGRVFSAATAVCNVAGVASLALGGLLTDLVDPRVGYAVCGALCLVATLGYAPSLLRLARRLEPRATQTAGASAPSTVERR